MGAKEEEEGKRGKKKKKARNCDYHRNTPRTVCVCSFDSFLLQESDHNVLLVTSHTVTKARHVIMCVYSGFILRDENDLKLS